MKIQTQSKVEQAALTASGQPLCYPEDEKIGVIVARNFPALGKLTALRFLEWVQGNPGGTVALPTGKTPEYFIKYCSEYIRRWHDKEIGKDLESHGVDPSIKPELKSLHFVQIDEFYPIDPAQHNSFHYYVNHFYIKDLSFDPKKALLIDCSKIGLPADSDLVRVWPGGAVDLSLRTRHAMNNQEQIQRRVLEEVDEWCSLYEERIRALGGIGFFLGGIGPDGHIAFNIRGTDHHSTTRLTPTNYETQAAAASDLGGMEVARKRHAITIGLNTITANPDCVAIIMAAGEAKARVVRDAVYESPHIRFPATALHSLSNARFYLTQGAARLLWSRVPGPVGKKEFDAEWTERIAIDSALSAGKPVQEITIRDIKRHPWIQKHWKKAHLEISKFTQVHDRLVEKVEKGCVRRSETVFLHTAPHHDDIMLGYFPYAVRHIRDASNRHLFTYMTSGFNAVTNAYSLSQVQNLMSFLRTPRFEALHKEGYFVPSNTIGRDRDVWQYLDGVAAEDPHKKREGEARRFYRNVIDVLEEDDPVNLENRLKELMNYLATQYPGKKDIGHIQKLKGMIREWEADCLWGYMGFDHNSVRHLRLGFYKGDIFTEEPTLQRDVSPILRLLHEIHPDIVTVALDPEASGPDTHYKVLQAIAEALRYYEKESGRSDITVLGYRNVWYRFHLSEATLVVPVSLNMFAVLQNAFMNAFVSQKDAPFPSHEFDGPFSGLAQKIQTEQYEMLKQCLGRAYFNEHPSPLVRATRGLVALREMSLEEFYTHAREIKKTTEAS